MPTNMIPHTCIKDDGGTPSRTRTCPACNDTKSFLPKADNTTTTFDISAANRPRDIYANGDEIRVKDPITGAEKGMKTQRFSLIPFDFIWALAEHYGVGARKYADRNWEAGYNWSLSLDAHSRHLTQWLMGEDNDKETGSSHLICAIWHLVALWFFHKRGRGKDDIRANRSA